MTIPGIGTFCVACILSAIKNINDFGAPCKILAYAGLDPVIRQSGKFNASHTRMSKRGNSLLRYALVWSAGNVVKNNHTFAEYYRHKTEDQGKSHYQALGHCAKNWSNPSITCSNVTNHSILTKLFLNFSSLGVVFVMLCQFNIFFIDSS